MKLHVPYDWCHECRPDMNNIIYIYTHVLQLGVSKSKGPIILPRIPGYFSYSFYINLKESNYPSSFRDTDVRLHIVVSINC